MIAGDCFEYVVKVKTRKENVSSSQRARHTVSSLEKVRQLRAFWTMNAAPQDRTACTASQGNAHTHGGKEHVLRSENSKSRNSLAMGPALQK